MSDYDFSGWATRNDLLCGDGRTIRKNAFKDNDGATVPLVWNHEHNDVNAVLGHAVLENRDDGVYAYGKFNDTEQGQTAKRLVQNGDVRSLSIWANKLKQMGNDVIHGNIRELSLVLAGANPGAFVDFVMAHGEGEEDTLIASYDENIMLYHSAEPKKEESKEKPKEEPKEDKMAEKTVKDVFDELTEEQKTVVYAMIGQALEDAGADYEEGEDEDNITSTVSKARVMIDTTGIFKDKKLVGYLSMSESKALNLIKGELSDTIITLDIKDGYIAFEPNRLKTKTEVDIKKNKVKITIEGFSIINEVTSKIDLKSTKEIDKLEKELNNYIKKTINDSFNNIRNNYNTDVFGFQDLYYKTDAKYFKQNCQNWYQDIFPYLEIEVESKIKLYEKGNTLGGIEYERENQ